MSCISSNIAARSANIVAYRDTSRLVIKIPQSQSPTVSIGVAIRYDAIQGSYVPSSSSSLVSSEVVGVVESVNSDNSRNVVIYGSINLPDEYLIFSQQDPTGAGGGNDVFFLSIDGRLQNIAPTAAGAIVKAVYRSAPHGNYTGIVVNSIGYSLGGNVQTSFTTDTTGVGLIHQYITTTDNSDLQDHVICNDISDSISVAISAADYFAFYEKYGELFGIEYLITVDSGTSISGFGTYNSGSNNTSLYDSDNLVNPFGPIALYSSVNESQNQFIFKKPNNKNLYSTPILSGGSYWIQKNTVWSGDADGTSNTDAFLQRKILFSSVVPYTLYLPKITAYSAQPNDGYAFFKDNRSRIDFRTNPINNTKIRWIVNTTPSVSALNYSPDASVQDLRTTTLNIDGQDIGELLLELENRLTYLESRLTM